MLYSVRWAMVSIVRRPGSFLWVICLGRCGFRAFSGAPSACPQPVLQRCANVPDAFLGGGLWMTLGLWIRRVGHLVRVLGCGDSRVMSGGECEEGWGGKDRVGCGGAGR